jgi:Capsule assembly protein Wzi
MKKRIVFLGVSVLAVVAQAQTPASVSYTPTWQARHHLQWLADNAALLLPVSQWPLPAAAVQQALDEMTVPAVADAEAIGAARGFVLKELQALRSRGRMQLHLRSESEGLAGYGENYTPGSSGQISTAEGRWSGDALSAAGRLGAKLEANANSMPANLPGAPHEGQYQMRLQGSEAVVGWNGWNVQAFSRQNWWGPGWQSSLINGHNNPAWQGVGIQRGSVKPSDSAWLSWMGPWSLDVFVAKAQDPIVVQNQPSGFLFSGARLTMKPQPWLELGLSRGMQVGGQGRPGGASNFVKAFLGQEVNQNPGDPPDSSGQIAGYDVRARCPVSWGTCAVYGQWMGEDAAGAVPLPFKFMSLWGAEKTFDHGRFRVFAEWANSNAYSLPWDTQPTFPGYVNGVYSQAYTQGARWAGPAQGSGSRVLTLGWMDAEQQRQFKLHSGTINTSLGVYAPTLNAPRGRLWGLSASQTMHWMGMTLTPELAYTHLAEGEDQGANKRTNLRAGLLMAVPF